MADLEEVLQGIRQNAEAAARIHVAAEAIRAAATQHHSGGKAEIHVNAGGTALWVALTIAAVMLAVNVCLLIAGVLWMGRFDREQSEFGHQLNAIYMMAPHLKPKEKKEVEH